MIRVLDTKYKSIGNILVIPSSEEEPFYVKSPIDFLLEAKDSDYTIVLRYTNYDDTFVYQSCKLLVTLETYDHRVVVLYIHNYLTPDPDAQSYNTGYTLSYKIKYNSINKTDLFMSFISEPILCP
jgi:hypothetical protein